MKKILVGLMIVLSMVTIIACQKSSPMAETTAGKTPVQETADQETLVEMDYLNQTPPDDVAIRFSFNKFLADSKWFWHGGPVFSKEGDEMYFSKYLTDSNHIEIWRALKVDGVWDNGQKLIIDDMDGDTNCPVFVNGDDGLYFFAMENDKGTIYRATRSETGWKNPVPLDIKLPEGLTLGWGFSMADNKNIYYSLFKNEEGFSYAVYMSEYDDGQYSDPIELEVINEGSNGTGGPKVAPDESYIFFESNRTGGYGNHDLYVSVKNDQGTYETPVNLGPKVNTTKEESSALVSPDGKYLFFDTQQKGDYGYNVYWIKLSALDFIQ